MIRLRLVSSLLLIAVASSFADEPKFDAASLEFFEKKVRPVLVARCFECHGDQAKPKGGLRLDSRAAVLTGGETGPAVVPGKPKDSLLVEAINYRGLYEMPPKSKLPADEIATLTKWVELGAPWPDENKVVQTTAGGLDLAARKAAHWCWQPPRPPSLPEVKNVAWAKTDVDRFLLARLEAKGLAPAKTADKRTLIRRAYFAVIGLPPTPEEVAAFVADDSPQAFEKVVDRLLDSVHLGERWARHWLDLVRYAETRGHEFEPIIPNAWQYRDYVIRAMNADVPYDQFVTEHLAGDLLEKPRLTATGGNESLLGTGFWFLGEEVHSPVDIRADETDRIDNRLDVFSKTFLALTLGCSRCHDHKFDAISQRDYYALAGFLLGGSYRQAPFEALEHNRRIAEQLDELRRTSRDELVKRVVASRQPVVERLGEYLSAARAAIQSGVQFGQAAGNVAFADFETDSYGDWKAEGEAFGDRPVKKGDNEYDAPLMGFVGQRFVNSHRNGPPEKNNAGLRDSYTGRLTSPSFKIDHGRIRFLIAGGSHAAKTCLNLLVDGKVVRTATGQNSGQLKPVVWDVADLRGKQAVIEIVDDHRGGWGHVIVDQIEFTNSDAEPNRVTAEQLTPASRAAIDKLAAERKLDGTLLARWVAEVTIAKSNDRHPLHFHTTDRIAPPAAPAASMPLDPSRIVVDWCGAAPWFQDGFTFGLRPVRPGDLRFGSRPEQPIVGVHEFGGAMRDPLWPESRTQGERDHGGLGGWDRSGKTLRTPEATLSDGRLWYLVRGSGRAYATVNSHLVIAGPLHGALLLEWQGKPDEWKWVSHNLAAYKGNRFHVEFSPRGNEDVAIAMVVQGDPVPPLVRPSLADPQSALESLRQFATGSLTDPARIQLVNWILENESLFRVKSEPDPVAEKFVAAQAELLKQVRTESPTAPAMLEGGGVDETFLVRGNSKTPTKPVPRRFLEALAGSESNYGKQSGRLQLAKQLVDPANPLTARVAVNRIWHHLFGRGLVPTVDNFGVLGEAPTHPELLDHLALQFSRDGWSQKRLIKSLLLTNAFQMSSSVGGPGEQTDPDNLLLHRFPIRRLEGEVIRDALLAVSGRLDRKPFGPSVPIHLTPFMDGRGRPGVNGPLDGAGRRSIYIAVRRNFLSPMMLAFDTPQPFSTVGRRTVSNVPAQALILMNDPLVLEQSRLLAARLLADKQAPTADRIARLYELVFSRLPTEMELVEAAAFLDSQGERLGLPAPQRQSAIESWSDLCHVLFNVKEFIFVN